MAPMERLVMSALGDEPSVHGAFDSRETLAMEVHWESLAPSANSELGDGRTRSRPAFRSSGPDP